MANINKIRLSGTTYNIEDENASKTVELTQAQYDALATKEPNTYYVITDATAVDIANYYTKTETDTALATKQDTLVSGTNIKTINNESILGSGNIEIQGGGGTTTGMTYDNPFITSRAFLKGQWYGFIADFGTYNPVIKQYVDLTVNGSFVTIGFNGSTDFYDNGGNLIDTPSYINQELNIWDSTNKRRYIFFKDGVYVNYIANTSGLKYTLYTETNSGEVVELIQDHIFNDAVHTTSSEKTAWNGAATNASNAITALGGLKLVSLTQAQYDALSTKDASTIYFING